MSEYYQDDFFEEQPRFARPGRRPGYGGTMGPGRWNCGCGGPSGPGNRPGGRPPMPGNRPGGRPPRPPFPPQPRSTGPVRPERGNRPSPGCGCGDRGAFWGQGMQPWTQEEGEIDEVPLQPWMWLDSEKDEQYWIPGDYFYPCGSQTWESRQEQLEKDLQYFMGMYPAHIQQLVMPVREAVDAKDQRDSFIYDEYPDRNQIDRMADEIINCLDPETMPEGEEGAAPCPLDLIVKMLLIQEILLRRNRGI